MKLPQTAERLSLADQQILWKGKNPRFIAEIATKFGISRIYVRRVFLGEIPSGELRVEKELAKRGCPGFEKYK